jgi:hypothetical protein
MFIAKEEVTVFNEGLRGVEVSASPFIYYLFNFFPSPCSYLFSFFYLSLFQFIIFSLFSFSFLFSSLSFFFFFYCSYLYIFFSLLVFRFSIIRLPTILKQRPDMEISV